MNNDARASGPSLGQITLYVLLGGGALWGLAALTKSVETPSTPAAVSGGSTLSIEQVAALLAQQHLAVTGSCQTVAWVSATSRVSLESHVADFFVPALAWARNKGSTLDEYAAAVAKLLLPGCTMPPPVLASYDIDQGLAGKLSPAPRQTAFDFAVSSAVTAQVFLSVRTILGALLIGGGG